MKTPRSTPSDVGSETVAVYIEPHPDVSSEELEAALKDARVTELKQLVPGIFSAQMPVERVRGLEAVAGVEVMSRKSAR